LPPSFVSDQAAIRSDFLDDIRQTLGFRTGLSDFSPAKWRLTIGEPDRVLLFVINNHLGFFVCLAGVLYSPQNPPLA